MLAFLCFAIFAFAVGAQTPSQLPFEWNEAVHALARGIAPAVGSLHTFSLDVKDITTSPAVDVSGIRRALSEQLTILGPRPAELIPQTRLAGDLGAPPAPAEFQLQVTISRNVDAYLMIAEITGPGAPQTVLVAVGKPEENVTRPAHSPGIERRVIWRQPRPILDFAQADMSGGTTLLYLLEADGIEMYEFNGDAQIQHQMRRIAPLYASRDPRGRLDLTDATHITALVGGVLCGGEWNPTFSVECHENSGQQWLFGAARWRFDPRHNYFSGDMSFASGLQTHLPAFYSAATPPPETSGLSRSLWITAGIDGQTQLFAGGADAAANFAGWGSDPVTVTLGCDSEWHVLAAGTGDWTQPDRLQLYEVKDRQSIAEGQPLELPGPLLVLWPAGNGKSARAVVHNLETNSYEASIITVACDN